MTSPCDLTTVDHIDIQVDPDADPVDLDGALARFLLGVVRDDADQAAGREAIQ